MFRVIQTIRKAPISRVVSLTPVRAMAHKLDIPTDAEQQAGRRREELEAEVKGEVAFNKDPIIPDVDAGTKENPILVSDFY